MAETAHAGTSNTGKFVFVIALLGSIAILESIETTSTEAFSKAFYIHSHAWQIKLWLAMPLLFSLIAGIPVWRDAAHGEMRPKTAAIVLSSIGLFLMFIYSIFLEVGFQHSI